MGQDGSVSIVTHCALDGPGIYTHPASPWGPPRLLYNGYWISFIGGKAAGA